MAGSNDQQLRFKVGDRVECAIGPDDPNLYLDLAKQQGGCLWMTGTVIKLRYENYVLSADGKRLERVSGPYQIRLDHSTKNGSFIYAPIDDNTCIRKSCSPHKCAGCGKFGGGVNLQHCGACKVVKYCGVGCQKAHRKKHVAECKRRVDDMHEEVLFKRPPPPDDCPICFLRYPMDPTTEIVYNQCCGKEMCSGCAFHLQNMGKDDRCPFCREARPISGAEFVARFEKRMALNDAKAYHIMGTHCSRGLRQCGVPRDTKKAFELWRRGAELGSADSYCALGTLYSPLSNGLKFDGVKADEGKAKHYWEQAAIRGNLRARHNLGIMELKSKDFRAAVMHFMISASGGHDESLKLVKRGYQSGEVLKDEFAATLRSHKESVDELKSEQRDAWKKSQRAKRIA